MCACVGNHCVCASVYACVQSPTSLSMYVIQYHFMKPSIDRVSGGVGCGSSLEQWQSPAVCVLDSAAGGRQGLKCHFMLGNKLSLHYPKPKPEMNFI